MDFHECDFDHDEGLKCMLKYYLNLYAQGSYRLKGYLNYYMLSKVRFSICPLRLKRSSQDNKLLDFPQVVIILKIEQNFSINYIRQICDIRVEL